MVYLDINRKNMFNEIEKTIKWGDKDITLSTGKIARQSDGAVMVKMGNAVLLCTATSAKKAKEDIGFFPLTVHYREMQFAAGKIPGGYLKREGRASDRETLVARLIDRPLRPLFHSSFLNETQVICTVLSYDAEACLDIMAIIGASAALKLSGVPFLSTVAASKVAFINGEYILNPSVEQIANSDLELIVAGTDSSVMMVESQASELSEDDMLSAVEFGHAQFQPVIKAIDALAKEAAKEAWETGELYPTKLFDGLKKKFADDIIKAFAVSEKLARYEALANIEANALEAFEDENPVTLGFALHDVKSDILRRDVLDKKTRIDGRKPDEIRQIECEAQFLPSVHGSALFTRGETQALVATTLGTASDEQMIDNIEGDSREHFMLNYIFPPYSVGEATPMRAPGRREIGHGKLAWRAIAPVLPAKEDFPYTLRAVSEVTESNGSSSMATVCGTALSLMDAGVPIKAPVAGIAMGLIKEGEDFIVLSDIMADEDHLGDMDFKVAGTEDGITALQMDIKVTGINFEIMKQALGQAKDGRIHILKQMAKALDKPRGELNKNAPTINSFKVHKDKIRDIIGPGGKVIKEICEVTGAKINIEDDGSVQVAATGAESMEQAMAMINAITYEPQLGDVFEDSKVVKVLESGAFVNYCGNNDGFVHISEIADERIEKVSDHLEEGKMITVKIIGFDHRGKVRLSMRLDADHSSESPAKKERRKPDNKKHSNDRRPKRGNKPDDKGDKAGKKDRNNKKDSEKPSDNNEGGGIIKTVRKYFS